VGANGVRAAETKFEMLRLIENVQVINAAPSKYGSPNPYRTDARWTADCDRSSEDKRDSWSYRNDAGTSVWHREIEPFAVHDLEISGNSMADVVCGRLPGVFNLDFDRKSDSSIVGGNPAPFYADVSPQLALGSLLGAPNEPPSCPPQSHGSGKE